MDMIAIMSKINSSTVSGVLLRVPTTNLVRDVTFKSDYVLVVHTGGRKQKIQYQDFISSIRNDPNTIAITYYHEAKTGVYTRMPGINPKKINDHVSLYTRSDGRQIVINRKLSVKE